MRVVEAEEIKGPPVPSSNAKNSWLGKTLSFAFGSLFLVVATVLFLIDGVQPILKWLDSLRWVEVTCKIDSAKVIVDQKTNALAYLPQLQYRYQWNEQIYHGTRFAWDTASYSRRESIEKWIEPYPEGKETVCFVNPDQPEEAVLLRSFPKPTLLVTSVTSIFILVGIEVIGTLLLGLLPNWSGHD